MSSPGKFRMNEGDWVCPDSQCGNINFARRSTCNRCGKEKSCAPQRKKLGHEIGKAAAEKSRGLFSADDWQCGRCGNVNWARRQQCNMCNAPKFGEVEERTGLGGGYNERENVEYIEREESDGEYDDFGRKKKKFRGSTTENSMDSTSHQQLYDEEEEEDDDDADLSKYDLGGWSDEEPKTDAPTSATSKKGGASASPPSRSLSSSTSRRSSRSDSSSSKTSRSRSRSRQRSRSRSRSRSYSSSSKRSGSPCSPRRRRRRQKRSRSRSRSTSADARSRRRRRHSSSSSRSSSSISSNKHDYRKRGDGDRDRLSSRSIVDNKHRC